MLTWLNPGENMMAGNFSAGAAGASNWNMPPVSLSPQHQQQKQHHANQSDSSWYLASFLALVHSVSFCFLGSFAGMADAATPPYRSPQ